MKLFLISSLLLLLIFTNCSFKQEELGNVFRYPLVTKIKGLDPARTNDVYSTVAVKQVYETLLEYHHLKRPYILKPLLADGMPIVSQDKLTITFKIKQGVYFQDDKCFKGKKRELIANDLIYSIKRLADVKVKSTGWWLFDNRIVGLNNFRMESIKTNITDYSKNVEGLNLKNKYSFEIKLTKACPQILYFFAMAFTSAMPFEAVNFYGEEIINNPVGTGPYKLIEWYRGLRLKYAKNKDYRADYYPQNGNIEDSANGLLDDSGKLLPLTDTLIFTIFSESQPMWLNFLRNRLDISSIPKDNFNNVISQDMTLKDEFKNKNIIFRSNPSLDLTYTCFNMEDSLLGSNVHLRRAMNYGWDMKKTIDLFYNGRAVLAQSPIPPGLKGYDKKFKNKFQTYNIEKAKEEMVLAGFPEGKNLPEIAYLTTDNTISRQWSEKFVKEMDDIGIKIKPDFVTWPAFLKRQKIKEFQICGSAWGADYPDPENFLQLLYGPNRSPGTNSANYSNSMYDSLYNRLLLTTNVVAKDTILNAMRDIVVNDCPWILGSHRLSTKLYYSWVKNIKFNDVSSGNFKYYKIDVKARNKYILESR